MNENKKVVYRKGESKKNPCPERKRTPCLKPRLITLDLCSVQRAINNVVGTLCNPAYQEQMVTITKTSVSNSLDTLQRLAQISCCLSKLDNKELNSLINCSIDDLMQAQLKFNSDLISLMQIHSSQTVDILEKHLASEEESESVPSSE